MVMISDRPADAEDRAVPGHWEGDLIIGKDCKSAVGTLVERTTRYVLLLHLPGGRDAHLAGQAMREAIGTLPAELARTITWDQGIEMAYHADFTIATGIPVYFCDPHAPWQRGSHENTNGLLRQYLPKGSDLSLHSPAELSAIARALNDRPRIVLGDRTPREAMRVWMYVM
jgi:IS30 family transposase